MSLETTVPAQGAASPEVVALATQALADLTAVKATADAGVGLVRRKVTIGFADFAGLAGGVKTYDVNLGAVLPANAELAQPPKLTGFTGFDDPAHGTYVATVGTSVGGNEIATSQSVAAGQTGFPKAMAAGANGFEGASLSGAQATVRITGSEDLNTATAGAVTVNLVYYVLAP